jgi:hypothetical protein
MKTTTFKVRGKLLYCDTAGQYVYRKYVNDKAYIKYDHALLLTDREIVEDIDVSELYVLPGHNAYISVDALTSALVYANRYIPVLNWLKDIQ